MGGDVNRWIGVKPQPRAILKATRCSRDLVLTCNDKRYLADREHVANCFSHYVW